MKKYLIFDFGKVLGYPPTGNWFITPKFLELININNVDISKLKTSIENNKDLVRDDLLIKTLDEEYNMFLKFYTNILSDIDYDKKYAKEIAYDRVYNFSKYKLYDDVISSLNQLKDKYKLIMLTDNWPSIIDYLKHNNIYDCFEKVYVSSMYGEKKINSKFFDIMLNEFKIDEGLFIDDKEDILDVAISKNLKVILMDRDNKLKSKYKKINSLKEIIEE